MLYRRRPDFDRNPDDDDDDADGPMDRIYSYYKEKIDSEKTEKNGQLQQTWTRERISVTKKRMICL